MESGRGRGGRLALAALIGPLAVGAAGGAAAASSVVQLGNPPPSTPVHVAQGDTIDVSIPPVTAPAGAQGVLTVPATGTVPPLYGIALVSGGAAFAATVVFIRQASRPRRRAHHL